MQHFILAHDVARKLASEACQKAPQGYHVRICEPTRSLGQNARLWSLLADVSQQVTWHGRKLSNEDWKHLFTSSLKKMDVVPNLEGTGFVALGLHTSKMTVKELSDLMELIVAFGIEHGVIFHDERTI